MSNTRLLLAKLIKTGGIGYEVEGKIASVEGSYNSVEFFETKEMDSSPIRLAHSQNKDPDDVENAIAVSRVQALLVEQNVDRRYIQNFFYYGSEGKKISIQASEGSLNDFLQAHYHGGVGQLTRDEIKDIFGQILLGVRALHEKNLVHRDIKTGNILITKDTTGHWFVQICDLDTIVKVNQNGTIAIEYGDDFVMEGGSYSSPELAPFVPWVHDCDLYLVAVKDGKNEVPPQILQNARQFNFPILLRVSNTGQYKIYGQTENQKWEWTTIHGMPSDAQNYLDSLIFNLGIPAGDDLFKNKYIKQILSLGHNAPLTKCWVEQTPENKNNYKKINLKADDCFALSVILNQLIAVAAPGQIHKDDLINDLEYRLRRTLPENRATIEAALTHPFFGFRDELDNSFTYHSFCAPLYGIEDKNNNASEHLVLNKFFQELLARKSPVEFIGKYRAAALLPDNYFFLMKENLKEIYVLLEKFNNQLDYFDSISIHSFKEKKLEVLVHYLEMSQESLHRTVDELTHEIENALKNYPTQSPVNKLLKELNATVKNQWLDHLSSIQLRSINGVIDAVKQNDLVEAAKHWQRIEWVTVKNYLAKSLKDEQLLEILQQQLHHQNELNDVIDLLEQAIEETADTHAAFIANKIVEKIKFPDVYDVADKDIPLMTELAHRMIIGLNQPDLADNINRMKNLAEKIPQCSEKLGRELRQIILMGVGQARLSSLSASWIFSVEPQRSRPDSEEKQIPASELTTPTFSI